MQRKKPKATRIVPPPGWKPKAVDRWEKQAEQEEARKRLGYTADDVYDFEIEEYAPQVLQLPQEWKNLPILKMGPPEHQDVTRVCWKSGCIDPNCATHHSKWACEAYLAFEGLNIPQRMTLLWILLAYIPHTDR